MLTRQPVQHLPQEEWSSVSPPQQALVGLQQQKEGPRCGTSEFIMTWM